MKIDKRRKLINFIGLLEKPLQFKPFLAGRNFLIWALLGLCGGLIAGLYWVVLDLMREGMGFFEGWLVIPVMTMAGLIAGLVIHFFGDPGELNLIVNNIRFNKGKLDPSNNFSMIVSSLFCVASGGSLGPEAPMVQVTGSMGTWFGKVFRMKGEDLRSMSIAGMGSAFTALFGSPFGGSLFSLEILHYRHALEYYKAIVPALVASCFSYLVFMLIVHFGLGPIWELGAYEFSGLYDFVFAVLFAMAGTAIGWCFILCVKYFKAAFEATKFPIYVKTAIGGILLGVIAYYLPLTRYFGHYQIGQLLSDSYTLKLLIALLVFKIIAIAITVTSGWRGGFIIPLFFSGATLGLIIHHIFPSVNADLAVISCMTAINVCVTRTPMSTTIMLATLTGFDYMIPILFASLTGYFLAPRLPFIASQHDDEEKTEVEVR